MKNRLSRRDFLKLGGAGILTAAGTTVALAQDQYQAPKPVTRVI